MSDAVKIALIGMIGTLMTVAGNVVIIVLIGHVKKTVNGKMTELLNQTAKASKAEGILQEKDKQEGTQ